ncbi:3980_t:CDS:2 [Diversispora eburnea]|uniref:3980_t:CDS:1 n=1 Tax=Diversispora eburnea TaxID=1213867 RepID=A0A9N9FQ47_9GLOM|nr:3980_t:CDS:2 [Diversispora eburnea]
MTNFNDINLLNAAFTAAFRKEGTIFISEKEFQEKQARHDGSIYNQIDLNSFQQSNLVSGIVDGEDISRLYVKTLTGKTVTLEFEENPKYHCDFTNIGDKGETFMRGGIQYQKPYGWRRFAIKVTGKYDNGDDTWLGIDNNSWPVSYHGTAKNNTNSIAEDGYLLSKGKRFAFGHGIYSTPNIKIAEMYAAEFPFEGQIYMAVIQNRVNPVNLHRVSTEVGEYWISRRSKDVRPYGICIKKKG